MRNTPAPSARYIAKFRNGIWQVFDAIYYGVVGSELTEKAANARAANLNARKAAPMVRR